MFSDPILEPNILTTFPNGTWVENLSARAADGNFLATVLSAPEVYLLSSSGEFDPILIAEFPGYLGVLGIVELGHDVFYVAVGNYSTTAGTSTPGSWSVWEIDLNGLSRGGEAKHHWRDWKRDGQAKTKLIAELPDAGLLNGVAVLNPTAGTILVGDSLKGTVWSVNVRTGDAAVVIDDESMAPDADLSGGLAIGINGLSVSNGYLYYDNTNQVTFYRLPINETTGSASGPTELLIDQEFSNIFPDDFALDFEGNAWLACQYGHVAFLEGVAAGERLNITAVAGNATGLPHGLTAAKFGTTAEDLKRGSLYVTTNGDPFSYGSDNPAQGQFVRYDTAVLGFY
ncbi:uncharacterized protein HMPREF1541_09086 [Cyphellophora europaea CBS 101466]|uniref:SMP-30/Gluconolactonase/LRE-like region domain-containing protein n=1 Tax=Cyphellophora europaea (strain CBS 101466) TaxID=1220924 RepID=W2S9D3_CYPE1|nr:uncharacterized protein HMPREF1541_09086 [Cyphellophora europaea CBS 101466]ETN45255.1 hypothetical protein HMPREF1541_09086 [Cyphellophora europaea CBS 101466]